MFCVPDVLAPKAPLPISIELKDPSAEKVEEILVRFDPFIAGKVAGNLASGIVPEVKLDALKAVKSIAAQLRFPEASVFKNCPLTIFEGNVRV